MSLPRIITGPVNASVILGETRDFYRRWMAFYERPRSTGLYGYGRTEAEAVLDLIDRYPCYPIECCERDLEKCNVCGLYLLEGKEDDLPCKNVPRSECGGVDQRDCTCRMETVHSASIDPPEMIVNRWCPIHGSGEDPDHLWEAARDDAAFFGSATYHEDDY